MSELNQPLAHVQALRSPRFGAARRMWGAPVIVALAFCWVYAGTMRQLTIEWQDPNYSVGMLVPFAALYLLWHDRERLARVTLQPAWAGLIVIVLAQAGRLFGLALLFESAERYSMVLTLAGLVILMGGWQLFCAMAHILALLLLAIPLPGTLHNHLSSPLQNLATSGAVATLELLGVVVSQEGNTLMLDHRVPVAVAEACSGLRMLTAFIFVSALLACIMARPRWQKAVILLSSVPIAMVANLVRLVITALLFMWTSDALANRFFHDFAGWTMMPLAIAILMGELWLMSRLVVEERCEPAGSSL